MRQKISEGFTQSQLDAAVQRAYQQGFSAGQQLVSKPTVDKQQLMDKVYDECRVIEESNPTMKPAITALRHRLKKV